MEYEFVSQSGAPRLILIYAGWAMDAGVFRGLRRPGYDIAVVWDYRNFVIDWSFASSYCEICIVAWSLGVYAASVSCGALESRTTCRIAVNGTLYPVDRRLGIPPAIFAATADGLNERQLYKFYRRVCGSSDKFRKFSETMPRRELSELVDELHTFLQDNIFVPDQIRRWDFALISSEDAIFPAVNQWRSWQGTPTVIAEGPHLPDMQKIIDRYIIDKEQTEERFARGLTSYDEEASVQGKITQLLEKCICTPLIFSKIHQHGSRILEIGSGTGRLSAVLDSAGENSYLEMWDLAGVPPLQGRMRKFRNVDAELELGRLPSSSFDMIASASTVQWFNSPTHFLAECLRVLAPGGFLVFSTFVRGNLWQVAEVTGRSLPLLTPKQWAHIIPAGFKVLGAKAYREEMEFDSPLDVFRHLKLTGVDSLGRSGEALNPVAAVRRFSRDLDGKYRITYRPIIIILRKEI